MKTILSILSAGLILSGASVCRAAIDTISFLNTAYTENFDTLASSGTSSTVPAGWAFSESGTGANTTYTAGTGSSATGDTYSYGSSASTERALGGLFSGSLNPTFGVAILNSTGGTIGGFIISYTGEQWRIGVSSRGAADRLDFQYSTDATSLTTGAWTDVNGLDYSSTVTSGTAGALNGNTAGNNSSVSGSFSVSVPNSSSVWFRWTDLDITPGADDGLAVDDFSVTAVPEPVTWALVLFGGVLGTVKLGHYWRTRRKAAIMEDGR